MAPAAAEAVQMAAAAAQGDLEAAAETPALAEAEKRHQQQHKETCPGGSN